MKVLMQGERNGIEHRYLERQERRGKKRTFLKHDDLEMKKSRHGGRNISKCHAKRKHILSTLIIIKEAREKKTKNRRI